MTLRIRFRDRLRRLSAAMLFLVVACGGEEPTAPNEDLAFLVGDWHATRFYIEHELNPDIGGDLVGPEIGATFTMNVQPSGQYTAVLTFSGAPLVEIGVLELHGREIVFNVQEPCCSVNRATYEYDGTVLRFEGPTEFDFNQDGAAEPARLDVTLERP